MSVNEILAVLAYFGACVRGTRRSVDWLFIQLIVGKLDVLT